MRNRLVLTAALPLLLLAGGPSPFMAGACADSGAAAAPRPADPAKTKRAEKFLGMAKVCREKGLARKAREYWEIAKGLDPSLAGENEAVNPSASPTPGVPKSTEPVFLIPDFKSDPDRPYNDTVKSLYEQAVDNYAKGDNSDAIGLLQKARELDPVQPQVSALLAKIKGPSESPLDMARKALQKGQKDKALALLEDYLNDHPDDPDALKLKGRIEGGLHPERKTQRTFTAKEPSPLKTPAGMSDMDRQAQADQAYNLGLDSYRQGDYAAAKKFWEQTLQIQPTHPQARRNLQRLIEEHPDLK